MIKKIITTSALTFCIALTAQAADEWNLAKDADGVKIYLKEVPGSKYKAFKSVITINANIERVVAEQSNAEKSCNWIHDCKSSKLLKEEGNQAWVYTRFKAPWPVTERDSILHLTTTKQEDGSFIRKIQASPTYLPEDKDYVRVQSVEGTWLLKPLSDSKVEVTYQLHTDPGGSVPAWLANKFVVDAPYNTLRGLKAASEK